MSHHVLTKNKHHLVKKMNHICRTFSQFPATKMLSSFSRNVLSQDQKLDIIANVDSIPAPEAKTITDIPKKRPLPTLYFPQETIPHSTTYQPWIPLRNDQKAYNTDHNKKKLVFTTNRLRQNNSNERAIMANPNCQRIFDCKNIQQLEELFSTMHKSRNWKIFTRIEIYQAFVRKACDLDNNLTMKDDNYGKGYEFVWNLFNCMRHSFIYFNEKEEYHPNLYRGLLHFYSQFISAAFNETEIGKIANDRVFALLNELKNICKDDHTPYPENLYANGEVYSLIFQICAKWKQTQNTIFVNSALDELFDMHDEYSDFWNCEQLWNSIIFYFGVVNDFETMMNYYQLMLKRLNPEFHKTDQAFAHVIRAYTMKHTITEMDVEIAEKVFIDCCQSLNRYPSEVHAWGALMNMYAEYGDLCSCLAMLNAQINKVNIMGIENVDCSGIPSLGMSSVSIALKCLEKQNKESEENGFEDEILGWQIIDYLYEQIKIPMKNTMSKYKKLIMYRMFLDICGVNNSVAKPNIIRLREIYDDMIMIDKLCPPKHMFTAVVKSGLAYYQWKLNGSGGQRNIIEQERNEFVEWCLAEFKRFNIKLSEETKILLTNNGCLSFLMANSIKYTNALMGAMESKN